MVRPITAHNKKSRIIINMDVLKTLDQAESAFFAISSSKDNNIVGFYLDENSDLVLKWIYRDDDLSVSEVRNFNVLESAMFSISIDSSQDQLLKLIFGLKLFDMEDYYVIQDPHFQGSKCVYFASLKEGPCLAREVYVDLKEKLAFIKCLKEDKTEFVEIKALKIINIF